MTVVYEERPSDSPFVQTIWHTVAESDGCDIVSADGSWDIIVAKQEGQTRLYVWGAMTRAMHVPHCQGDEHLGIRFKPGTYLPSLPAKTLLNVGMTLPQSSPNKSFWLDSSTWQYPNYENAETFISKLVHDDLLICDPVIDGVLQGTISDLSLRSVQRHFLRATGLTHNVIRQIERARQAALLLQQGVSIVNTVHQVGYADQSHMTRALKQFIGQTPAQIAHL
ncbi:MAG: AraC family transcriptional regulator [Anaerolineae bacterium]|nr:helix-turn-helix transcriptional regulator [Anaerolineae bacterium]